MLNPSPERERGREGGRGGGREGGREGERVRVGERGRERGGKEREGERGRERGGREREREGGGGGGRGGEGEFRNVYTCTCKCIHTHIQQADMHTHCVPIIMYTIPTLREISVTTRADKVFLMPAQVLGSDTWLQRERETERVGINTIVIINWNNFVWTTSDVTPSSSITVYTETCSLPDSKWLS